MKNIDEIKEFAKTAENLEKVLEKISQYLAQADESMGKIADKNEEIDAELIFGEYNDKVEELNKKANELLSHFSNNPDKLAESIQTIESCEKMSVEILNSLEKLTEKEKNLNELYEKARQYNELPEKLLAFAEPLKALQNSLIEVDSRSNSLMKYKDCINDISQAVEAAQRQYASALDKITEYQRQIDKGNAELEKQSESIRNVSVKVEELCAFVEKFEQDTKNAIAREVEHRDAMHMEWGAADTSNRKLLLVSSVTDILIILVLFYMLWIMRA